LRHSIRAANRKSCVKLVSISRSFALAWSQSGQGSFCFIVPDRGGLPTAVFVHAAIFD
jgi:hypothetical protein